MTPAFTLADGPRVEPIPLTPTAGRGQGVFAVDRDLGSGYVQQWNASVQRELTANLAVEVAYVGSKITRVGIPDANLNQLTVDQLALGPALSEFAFAWDLTPETTQKRTEHWASFGLRDARMMAKGDLGLLMPDDVARVIVHAVTQPRHVLVDTIELQPAVPRRPG